MANVLKLRILLVEDEPDIRETLTEILQLHDYETVAVDSAEAAMVELRGSRFELLLTDFNLPGQSGGWLVEQATQAGLLAETAVLLVTAHPTPQLAVHVVVMPKPLDIDRFLSEIQRLLQPATSQKIRRAQASLGEGPRGETPGELLELVLYVSAGSPASLRAVRNLNGLLERFPGLPIHVSICDLSTGRTQAAADRVALTPTLVKRGPGPRAWILGTLDDARPVLDLLEMSGLAPEDSDAAAG